jgi:hypothetical protein
MDSGVSFTEGGVSLFAGSFRREALAAGRLHDVSEMASEAGFAYPVAVTRALWEDIQAIPPAYSHEDVQGRLWDILHMAWVAVRTDRTGGREIRYNLVLHVGDSEMYGVGLVCGPGDAGEPVLTLSSVEKDIDLPLGSVVMTEGALDAFMSTHVSPTPFLQRHRSGDWGELDDEDVAANNRAARGDERILSAYTLPGTGERIWVITEWDRSATTILLPSEY